ncbi:MAG: cellulose biosynthesis protein [Planctomycetaceae bacterium]|jgi:CelD/BcsL family acetyltransferase involved in cellulose biosynthesis|nr:cellulose biosynthesis protein [Planctomycetaceae bacterium]
MAEVLEINDIEELESHRLCWAALLNETLQASFFQSLDWLQAYWRHFGHGQHLRALVVFNGGRPIGILPLAVRQERTRIGRTAVLTYPLHDWGSFYGPIGPNPTATLLAAVRHIRKTERDWDLFDPRWVNAIECDRGRTETAMQAVGLQPRKQHWNTTWIIDFADTWQIYLQGRKAKFRENIRRTERRAAVAGEVTFERYRPLGVSCGDANPRWDLFSQCVDLAARSGRSDTTTGKTLSHESARAFLRDANVAAANRGALDVCLLKLDGRPIAYAYNYQLDGRIEGLRMGYHPAFAAIGPGTLLMSHMIRDSVERQDTSLDLGVDHAQIKRRWATRGLGSYRYTHYAPTSPKAQILRAKHWWDARRRTGANE